MDEKKNENLEPTQESESPNLDDLNAVQRFYEHFRGVPLKYIDMVIIFALVGLVGTIVIGVLRSKGIL